MKLLLFLILLFPITAAAQSIIPEEELLFLRGHTTILFSPTMNVRATHSSYGGGDLTIFPSGGAKLGVLQTVNFSPKWGVETGLSLGFLVYPLDFIIAVPEYSVAPYPDGAFSDAIPMLEVPFAVVRRFQIGDKDYLYSKAGFLLQSYPPLNSTGGMTMQDSIAGDMRLFHVQQDYASERGLTSALTIGAGWLNQTKGGNFTRWGVVASFSRLPMMRGTYKFFDTSGQVAGGGDFLFTNTFVGLEIGYVFSHSKRTKRLLKLQPGS